MSDASSPTPRRRSRVLLWLLALLIMLSAATYQRLTGPTHPERVRIEMDQESWRARLPRSGTTDQGTDVRLPAALPAEQILLRYRRYPSDDLFTSTLFVRTERGWTARLPVQPAAGKVEYFVEVVADARTARLPEGGETVVLRYKDPVPLAVLLPHVLFMFTAMLVGVRAALSAMLSHADWRRLSLWTLGLLTVGGMILGPVVQKFAFGALWTGWPLGYDLTDNKTLIMWLVWILALGFAFTAGRARPGRARAGVVLAALVMIAVYLVPHSLGGSELDYEALDRGLQPHEAIDTGL